MEKPLVGGPDYSGKKGFDVQDLMRKAGLVISFTAEDGTEYEDEWDSTLIAKKGIRVSYLNKLWNDERVAVSGADFDRVVAMLKVDPAEFAAFLTYKNAVLEGVMEVPMIPDPNPQMIPDYINGWQGAYLAQIKGEIPEEEEVEDEEAEDEDDSEAAEDEDDSDL